MRILLIAYEFPPIISGQSLRWFYLSNELAKLGVEVHVICTDMPALPKNNTEFHPGVKIHRVWAGPYVGLSQLLYLWLSKPRENNNPHPTRRKISTENHIDSKSEMTKLYRVGRRFLDKIIFPDLRSEWFPSAVLRMRNVLRTNTFNALVASHEPGISLMLGLLAKRRTKLPLVVDIGDPITTSNAPRWRRRFEIAFEAIVLKQADAVVVTTEAAKNLCMQHHEKHDLQRKFVCISQGFPSKNLSIKSITRDQSRMLRIVYTGNFYSDFRSPKLFAEALKNLDKLDIHVDFYGNHESHFHQFSGLKNTKFWGLVDHEVCLCAQQSCDLLLSIGNLQSVQIPGKIFEYLGVGAPILHISTAHADEAGELIKNLGAGWTVYNDPILIENTILYIYDLWKRGILESALKRNQRDIEEYSWSRRAIRVKDLIEKTISNHAIDNNY